MKTPQERKTERAAALNDLLTACSARCPNAPAMTTILLLDDSLRNRPAEDAFKHAQTMNLLTSALSQIQAGATTLDLNPPHPQPTIDGVMADLERDLPRGPGQAG